MVIIHSTLPYDNSEQRWNGFRRLHALNLPLFVLKISLY